MVITVLVSPSAIVLFSLMFSIASTTSVSLSAIRPAGTSFGLRFTLNFIPDTGLIELLLSDEPPDISNCF